MKDLTALMLIEFNKMLHDHGIPKDTQERMENFLRHLKKSARNDLEILAWILYYLLQEHPFIDGNKRTADFVLDYYLDKKRLFLPNTRKLQLILKWTGPEWGPREIYRDLRRELITYNPNFKP